jgi:quinol monooxygenase YgiN
MSGFVQIIEFKTNRADELQKPADEMASSLRPEGALRGTVTQDRDRPGWYFNIVEFDSYESAMSNSNRPEVSAFAARMAGLCEEPPRFYNLDVKQTWSAGTSTTTKAAVATAATALAGAAATGLTKARQRVQERGAQRPRTTTSPITTPPQTPPPRVVADDEGETVTDVDDRTPPPSSPSGP